MPESKTGDTQFATALKRTLRR